MTLWIQEPKKGARAACINHNPDGTYEVLTGTINNIISQHGDFNGDSAKYLKACDEMLYDDNAAGEFITDDDCYYVSLVLPDETIIVDDVNYIDAAYC
jgi:hypothetical protein